MGHPSVKLGEAALNDLLKDAGIIKIVTAVNVASISILELLEYDVTRQDINRAFAKGVISFDKSSELSSGDSGGNGIFGTAEALGDQYFRFLSSKVKLTQLGLFILETIEYHQEGRTGNEPSVSASLAVPEPNYQPSTMLWR